MIMNQLAEMKCEACDSGASVMGDVEIRDLIADLPDWNVETVDGEQRLSRVLKFKNFADALAFTNKVGSIAEEVGHHPALLTEYGKVTVDWWTHKIGGVHSNDFI